MFYENKCPRLVQDRTRLLCGFWKLKSCAHKARTCTRRTKSLVRGSCANKAFWKTVYLERTRPSHKTWAIFRTRPSHQTVLDFGLWRLGRIMYFVFARAPARRALFFFSAPVHRESRARTRSVQDCAQDQAQDFSVRSIEIWCFFSLPIRSIRNQDVFR